MFPGHYLSWLYHQLLPGLKNPRRSYIQLIETLSYIPFEWSVPNDDNRIEDGLEIRWEYFNGPDSPDAPCSMLEMLVGLARRCSFETDDPTDLWFWHFVGNLGLLHATDEDFDDDIRQEIQDACNRLMYRTYARDGSEGGLFPLTVGRGDQRRIELWYQMSSYILEGHSPR